MFRKKAKRNKVIIGGRSYVLLCSLPVYFIDAAHIGRWIVSELYGKYGLTKIGFDRILGETSRFVIYCEPNNLDAIEYFEMRCPGMIEEKIRDTDINDVNINYTTVNKRMINEVIKI